MFFLEWWMIPLVYWLGQSILLLGLSKNQFWFVRVRVNKFSNEHKLHSKTEIQNYTSRISYQVKFNIFEFNLWIEHILFGDSLPIICVILNSSNTCTCYLWDHNSMLFFRQTIFLVLDISQMQLSINLFPLGCICIEQFEKVFE